MADIEKAKFEPLEPALERLATLIVDSAFKIHSTLGPGLLESVYEACLAHELTGRGIEVKRQVMVPIIYGNMRIDESFRIDLLVQDSVIIEVKAVEKFIPVFEAQLLTYLKLAQKRLGFLINFNVPVIKQGIKRMIR